MSIKEYIKNLRTLPETKKRIIFFSTIMIAGLVLGFFTILSTKNNIGKIGNSLQTADNTSKETSPGEDMGIVSESRSERAKNDQTSDTSTSLNTDSWKTYTNKEYGFSFEYPVNSMILLASPEISMCDNGKKESINCEVLADSIDGKYIFYGQEWSGYHGITMNILQQPLDQVAIHKYDSFPQGGNPNVNVTEKINIGGKEGYEYHFVGSTNYKIDGFMIQIDDNHFLEVYENSKYPITVDSDWKRMISTFKFTPK